MCIYVTNYKKNYSREFEFERNMIFILNIIKIKIKMSELEYKRGKFRE